MCCYCTTVHKQRWFTSVCVGCHCQHFQQVYADTANIYILHDSMLSSCFGKPCNLHATSHTLLMQAYPAGSNAWVEKRGVQPNIKADGSCSTCFHSHRYALLQLCCTHCNLVNLMACGSTCFGKEPLTNAAL